MTVKQLSTELGWNAAAGEAGLARAVTGVFCCDLLSHAMGKAPAGCAWVTVIGNVNVVAVCELADIACVVLAAGIQPDNGMKTKADAQGIPLLCSPWPIYETARAIGRLLGD